MNAVIMNSNKQTLIKYFLLSKNKTLKSSRGTINLCCDISRPIFHNSFPFSEMSSITCMHCSSATIKQSSDKLNNMSSVYLSRVDYSSFLSVHSKHHSIQNLQKRFKSKKTSKGPEYDSDSDEEDYNDEGDSKATKPVIMKVQSLRLDGLLKKALGLARNKVETYFYEGNLRINGSKPSKKSYQVKEGDEVDLIKGVSPMNSDFLLISRVEVISVREDPDEEGQLIIKIRRTKTMYVDNYETDPWKRSSV